MHLLFDVGNTETVVGLARPGTLDMVAHWRLSTHMPRTADEVRVLLRALLAEAGHGDTPIERAVVGSVVPRVTSVLVAALETLAPGAVFTVEASSPLSVRLDVDEPLTVGADRIVNTLAAARLYGRDTIAVDLGTATTFDCITADGVFQGGVIAPGVSVGLEWFSQRTAKLPRIGLELPERVIGRRTEDCMRSGVFWMAVDGVDGMVDRIRAEWGRAEPLVVATGGFSTLLGPHCRTVERVEPLLTLRGLMLAGEELSARGG
ncbi:MAG: type III pantothenate kinase [Gemmatimonadetes bacterium]|nr:type III pantothenate kinase [Gemmatimonadota bacterium]